MYINNYYLCDGKDDCVNGEDELNCSNDEDYIFVCRTTKKRINYKFVCDYHSDCSDGSDEIMCCKYNFYKILKIFINHITDFFFLDRNECLKNYM